MTDILPLHRRKLSANVPVAIAGATSLKVGRHTVPDDVVRADDGKLLEPYIIVYAISDPRQRDERYGSWERPDEAACLEYQLTCVGANDEQAQWAADKARDALLTRSPNGEFKIPITADDAVVLDRRPRIMGGPEPAGGGLWQVIDTYDLEVLTSG